MDLTDILIQERWLKTPRIITAFRQIKRIDFLPETLKDLAETNEALPISSGQTISQPLVVAFMLELLEPKAGEKVLDIGSGSGWTTALLAEIVGPKGKVIAIDIIPELVEFGKNNVAKYNFIEKGIVEFICADGSKGYPVEEDKSSSSPFASARVYDKILISAAAQKLMPAWQTQLKIGGRIVVPIDNSIWLFIKKTATEFERREYPGFVFVPLITK